MSDSGATSIDWATAAIHDGTLTVKLTGGDTKTAAKLSAALLELLDRQSGGWGNITIRRGTITVEDVREGSESDLRHLLESVLLEVNSRLDVQSVEAGREAGADPPGPDERMTEAFREFSGREG